MPDPNKQLETLLDESIQRHASDPPLGGGPVTTVLSWLWQGGNLVPPWWSRERDARLRRFWKQNDALASAVYTLQSKLLSIPFHVEPRSYEVKAHVAQADLYTRNLYEMTAFGKGWLAGFAPALEDLFGQDNGMMVEIIGEGPKDGPIVGSALGLAPLDSGRCLGRDSRVMLTDGRTEPLWMMVERHHPGPVLSIGKSGQLEPKKVIGWYKTNLGDRYWLRIRTRFSSHTFGRPEGLWVTNDHEFMTPSGWVRADDLSIGDKVATPFREPNDDQMSFVVGLLLGDGHLKRLKAEGNLSCLSLSQGDAQREWLDAKREFLSDFGLGEPRKNVQRNSWTCESKASPFWLIQRDAWYPNGKKIVNRGEVSRYFNPRMWAAWYCDDGNLQKRTRGRESVRLYTQSFSLEDNIWLSEQFALKGITCLVRGIGGQFRGQFYLYFPINDSQAFLKLISPYILPSLRYKLPDGMPAFDETLWASSPTSIHYAEIVEIQEGTNGGQLQSFCLDVEDNHNFVVGKMVVHNCTRTRNPLWPIYYTDLHGERFKLHHTRVIELAQMPSPLAEFNGIGFCAVSRAINAAQNLYDIATYKMEKLGSRPKRQILVGRKGLTVDNIFSAFRQADIQQDAEGLSRYSKVIAIAPDRATANSEVALDVIDLASAPDGFNEQESVTLGVYILAWAFGVDAREFWPATSSGATKADAMVQHMKARGKAIGNTVSALEKALDRRYLPPHLKLVFDVQDDDEDAQRADIADQESATIDRDVKGGVYDVRVARQKMLQAGRLSQDQYDELELSDGRMPGGEDALSMFYSSDPLLREMLDLGVDDPLDDEEVEWEEETPPPEPPEPPRPPEPPEAEEAGGKPEASSPALVRKTIERDDQGRIARVTEEVIRAD